MGGCFSVCCIMSSPSSSPSQRLGLTKERVNELKKQVLKDQVHDLSKNLGNLKSYFRALRAKGVLNQDDCEIILNEVTMRAKVAKMVDLLCEGRQGRDGSSVFDVLVEVLSPGVARNLQKALEEVLQEEAAVLNLDSEEENDKNMVPPETVSDDRMESHSYQAEDRGAHRPRLQLDATTDQPAPHEPEPHNQLPNTYYPMSNLRHGVALIINNKQFHVHSERLGTDRDEVNLVETWRYLGYRVEIRRNCTSLQIEDLYQNVDTHLLRPTVDSEGGSEVPLANDSFVSCILSHGECGKIVGADSKDVCLDELERSLGRSNILHGKPKLFFVQSCRGSVAGAEIQANDGIHRNNNAEAVVQGSQVEADEEQQEQVKITNRSDIFLSYATVSGNKAYRDTMRGSWFIVELCKTLCRFSTSCTLNEMQHKVNKIVSSEYVAPSPSLYPRRVGGGGVVGGGGYAQQPGSMDTMTKYVHFFHSDDT